VNEATLSWNTQIQRWFVEQTTTICPFADLTLQAHDTNATGLRYDMDNSSMASPRKMIVSYRLAQKKLGA